MTHPSATILADSVSPEGVRLTTFELVIHRFVLAEFNTHALARSSASSRAVPISVTLHRYGHDPAWPLKLPVEQPGMSGGAELEGRDSDDAVNLLSAIHDTTYGLVQEYVESHEPGHRLHKSVLNRYLEPFGWHRLIATGDQWCWGWYFGLRVSEFAQPEIEAPSRLAQELYLASDPTPVEYGEWHLPLVDPDEVHLPVAPMLSASRCARSSYDKQHEPETVQASMARAQKLSDSFHLSPFEHPATPLRPGEPDTGKFGGWRQLRAGIEGGAYGRAR